MGKVFLLLFVHKKKKPYFSLIYSFWSMDRYPKLTAQAHIFEVEFLDHRDQFVFACHAAEHEDDSGGDVQAARQDGEADGEGEQCCYLRALLRAMGYGMVCPFAGVWRALWEDA